MTEITKQHPPEKNQPSVSHKWSLLSYLTENLSDFQLADKTSLDALGMNT